MVLQVLCKRLFHSNALVSIIKDLSPEAALEQNLLYSVSVLFQVRRCQIRSRAKLCMRPSTRLPHRSVCPSAACTRCRVSASAAQHPRDRLWPLRSCHPCLGASTESFLELRTRHFAASSASACRRKAHPRLIPLSIVYIR